MASTVGLVQKLKVTKSAAFAYIGATPTTTELFTVSFSGASASQASLLSTMVDTLASCLVRSRQVEVFHDAGSAVISTVLVV